MREKQKVEIEKGDGDVGERGRTSVLSLEGQSLWILWILWTSTATALGTRFHLLTSTLRAPSPWLPPVSSGPGPHFQCIPGIYLHQEHLRHHILNGSHPNTWACFLNLILIPVPICLYHLATDFPSRHLVSTTIQAFTPEKAWLLCQSLQPTFIPSPASIF